MKTSTYATQLKSVINSQVYSSVVYSLGSQLNDRKDRFDKADIIEQTVEAATDGRLVWIDDIGRDHRDTIENLDIEFKYMTDGMFTKRNKQKKTVKVKLKNSLGAKTKALQLKTLLIFICLVSKMQLQLLVQRM